MKNSFKVNEIGEELNISNTTVYRMIKRLAKQLKPYRSRQGKTILISSEGLEIIKNNLTSSDLNTDQHFVTDKIDDKTDQIDKTGDQTLINMLTKQLEKTEQIIREKEEHIRNYQQLFRDKENELREHRQSNIEERKRTDTIIMSLTNRLEDIQKRLPALPAPEEKKPGVLKRFISWFTTPDQKPVDWEQTELFRKAE
jgi:Mn-dependent DtxR family transcriptional regulator